MSTNFTLSASGIIRVAHQLIGITPAGQNPDSDQLAMGYDVLNLVVKDIQDRGIVLSTLERTTTTLVAGQAQYTTAADTLDIDDKTPYCTNNAGADFPVLGISRGMYMELSLKTTQGQPTQMYVEKGATGVSFFLFPTPDVQWSTITFPRVTLLSDTSVASDSTGLPSRYLLSITKFMMAELSEHYPLPESKRARLRREAETSLERVTNDDTERGDIVFRPSYGVRIS